MHVAQKKAEKSKIKFEGIVIGGHSSGTDLTTFANNPANKIDQIVIGSRGMGFPKDCSLEVRQTLSFTSQRSLF